MLKGIEWGKTMKHNYREANQCEDCINSVSRSGLDYCPFQDGEQVSPWCVCDKFEKC